VKDNSQNDVSAEGKSVTLDDIMMLDDSDDGVIIETRPKVSLK